MVRQWQEMFYDERYSEVYLSPDLPDYVKWAEAMGCVGIRVDRRRRSQPAIEKANSINDRPVVVDFRVDAGEKVFPMVPAGQSNDDDRAAALADATGDATAMSRRRQHHILSVLVAEPARRARPGRRPVRPARVQHLLARGAPAEDEGFSRITIVVDVESAPLEQITKQLFKLSRWSRSASSTRAARSSASCCCHGAGPGRTAPPGGGAGHLFEAKILAVGRMR